MRGRRKKPPCARSPLAFCQATDAKRKHPFPGLAWRMDGCLVPPLKGLFLEANQCGHLGSRTEAACPAKMTGVKKSALNINLQETKGPFCLCHSGSANGKSMRPFQLVCADKVLIDGVAGGSACHTK